jgi:hypothetical protein
MSHVAQSVSLDVRELELVFMEVEIFSLPKTLDQLWGTLSLLSNRYLGSFPGDEVARA